MSRRTIRRYASELYPHPDECEVRDLAIEVPYLYAHARGLAVLDTSWHDMLSKDQPEDARRLAWARTENLCLSAHMALLSDALLQGMDGQEAWAWAMVRTGGDTFAEWVWERGTFYGVDLARIKPNPCGPEPRTHSHMASTGNVLGFGNVTRIDCPESDCPDCTEDVPEVTP